MLPAKNNILSEVPFTGIFVKTLDSIRLEFGARVSSGPNGVQGVNDFVYR